MHTPNETVHNAIREINELFGLARVDWMLEVQLHNDFPGELVIKFRGKEDWLPARYRIFGSGESNWHVFEDNYHQLAPIAQELPKTSDGLSTCLVMSPCDETYGASLATALGWIYQYWTKMLQPLIVVGV